MHAKRIHDNPSAEELRAFTEDMPTCRVTEFGNVDKRVRIGGLPWGVALGPSAPP